MGETKKIIKKQVLPLLPLRGLVVYPFMALHFDVGRSKSIKALEEAMVNDQLIFLVAQKDAKNDNPDEADVYNVGTISRIKQLLRLPGDTLRVLVEGISRAEISQFTQSEPFFMAEVTEKVIIDKNSNDIENEALVRRVVATFDEYIKLNTKVSPEVMLSIMSIDDVSQLADTIVSNISLKLEQRQEILEEFNATQRLEKLLEILLSEIEILEAEKNINTRVRKQIDKTQKEYYLREQLKAIQTELGDKEGVLGEVEEYKEKLAKRNLPEEVMDKANKEIDRLLKMPQGSAEGSVIRTYLDWILDLPWDKKTDEFIDLKKAKRILDEDHFGLEKVKERVIEYLAVRKMQNSLKGPILCLYGPPGVGKTSIARSIAASINRNYVRMSLGGVKDESEIRGHRRTYVGSMPGRIVNALKQAGSKNPLILLDEIDKMSSDFRGDPASAMLEVLDSEQNNTFRDHYMELPFDLSDAMFITTANSLDTIPRPLLDRMEIITLSSYTEEEKLNIAMKHLLSKEIERHGLKPESIKMNANAMRAVINGYTREAGVRSLERQIANICRKVVREILEDNKESVTITTKNLEKYLGNVKVKHDKINPKDEVGIVTGMAWTQVGGEVLSIEVNTMKGNGRLELTGQLGDVMKESARLGLTYIRSKVDELGINPDFYNTLDIHIHIPEGATPKDGPSAGITMATAVISALTNIPVRRDVAMTGEITLRGRVLPIGGLREKVMAAHRAGIKTIIVPIENKKDIEEIPENIRKQLKFVYAETMDTVIKTALCQNAFNIAKKAHEEQQEAKLEVATTTENLNSINTLNHVEQ